MSKNKKGLILSIIGILGLVVITVGVTYAFFHYVKEGTTENSITSGTITFLYTEVSEVGRGISIEDAYPMSDEIGKVQIGEGKVFDFKITSNTSNSTSIPYEVTARKKKDSTLAEEVVKLYLTEVDGNLEEEILLDNYSNLVQTTKVDSSRYIEKTIYEGKVPVNSINYEKNFRLRIWIDEDTDFGPIKGENGEDIYPYNGKEFTITINVYSNGKVVTEEEKVLEESIPTFNSQNYPLLTEYGVIYGVSINYSEESIQKLYRVNKGKWQNYENIPIELKSYDILEAKSVFVQGIESNIADYKITEDSLSTLPPDALGPEAYDGDEDSSIYLQNRVLTLYIDQQLWNKKVLITNMGYKDFLSINLYNSNGEIIQTIRGAAAWEKTEQEITILENTAKIVFDGGSGAYLYEVKTLSTPMIIESKYYPKMTVHGIEYGYNEVVINYFQTSIEKLYRVNNGEWKNYQGKMIRLKLDDKIEVKGIDINDRETEISSYVAVLPEDALGPEAYDGDEDSSIYLKNKALTLYIDQQLWNNKILITNMGYYSFLSINLYNSNGELIQTIRGAAAWDKTEQEITILENTTKIVFDGGSGAYLYEVKLR